MWNHHRTLSLCLLLLGCSASPSPAPASEDASAAEDPTPLPTPMAVGSQVYVNASITTGDKLPIEIFGQSMPVSPYPTYKYEQLGDPTLIATVKSMNIPFFRVLWKYGDAVSMSQIFPDATSTGDFIYVDRLIAFMKAVLPETAVLKLDPELPGWYYNGSSISNDPSSNAALQRQYKLLAQHFLDAGIQFKYWQGPGEFTGSSYDNGVVTGILTAGVHEVDPDAMVGGPGSAWADLATSDLAGFLTSFPNPGYAAWDDYFYNPGSGVQGSLDNMMSGTQTTLQLMDATLASHGLHIPKISTEFNLDSGDTGVNLQQSNVVYVAAHCWADLASGTNVVASASWHLFNGIVDAGTFQLRSLGQFYKYVVAVMGGDMLETSVGGDVPGSIKILTSRRGGVGSIAAVMFINSNLSHDTTVDLQTVGWADGTVTRWEHSPDHPNGESSSIDQAELGQLHLPASSIVIVSGTVR